MRNIHNVLGDVVGLRRKPAVLDYRQEGVQWLVTDIGNAIVEVASQ